MEPSALSLLPPLVAIVLAIWWRNVLPALFIGIWVGTTILEGGRPDLGLLRMLDTLLPEELASLNDKGGVDYFHVHIVLFTLFLGAMIGVMSESGGSKAVVDRIARKVDDRRKGQTLTWFSGLVVFFDDYANTLLIGGTMRPVTDRLKISREKLAFLIDATAAPVAGIAVISTWAGFEVGLIVEGFQGVEQQVNGWQMFVETIPYRFYPLTMLVFVFLIGWTGRDYGPMHAAETAATNADDEGVPENDPADMPAARHQAPLMRHALIPLVVLLSVVAIGMLVDMDRAAEVLVFASFLASVAAVASTLLCRTMSLNESIDAWVGGIQSMVPAMVILVMAWMIGGICDKDHLQTGSYIQQVVGDSLNPTWMPAISFLVSAAVSFSTGSSFATMILLVEPFTILSWNTFGSEIHVTNDPLMLATIGSVLAGSIFGDHCSPISDTTVLSSAASDCDHLRHVETQLPYAFTVGLTSLLLGCVPIGFGFNVWMCLLLQLVALYVIIRFFGRPPGAIEKQFMPKRVPVPVVAIEPAD
jgi:Na+/H+ antiporter NhaC